MGSARPPRGPASGGLTDLTWEGIQGKPFSTSLFLDGSPITLPFSPTGGEGPGCLSFPKRSWHRVGACVSPMATWLCRPQAAWDPGVLLRGRWGGEGKGGRAGLPPASPPGQASPRGSLQVLRSSEGRCPGSHPCGPAGNWNPALREEAVQGRGGCLRRAQGPYSIGALPGGFLSGSTWVPPGPQ